MKIWEKLKKYYYLQKDNIDCPFELTKNDIPQYASFTITVFGFTITAFSFLVKTKEKHKIKFRLTTSKILGTITNTDYEAKAFDKLIKELEKRKYLFYIVSNTDDDISEKIDSHYVVDNAKNKFNYYLFLEDALKIVGDKLDSSKKNMPKRIWGVSKTKFKCLYKANKKVCDSKKYWVEKGA